MDDISLKLADPCSILQFQSKTLIHFPDPQEAKGLVCDHPYQPITLYPVISVQIAISVSRERASREPAACRITMMEEDEAQKSDGSWKSIGKNLPRFARLCLLGSDRMYFFSLPFGR